MLDFFTLLSAAWEGELIYNIALVDDETNVSDQLEEWIKEYGESTGLKFNTDKFTGTTEFMKSHYEDYNIIFMDINLPNDVNGINTAKKLREECSKAVIIFCTNYAQYAVNGYEVGALSYLIKPVKKESFTHNMDRAVRALNHMGANKMILKTLEGQKFVNIADIVYIEVMVHNLYFHIKSEGGFITERTRGALNDISDKFANMNFARCSSCYLVNLAHVTGVGKKSVQLVNGDSLTLSRKYMKDFMNNLMHYVAEFGIIDG